MQSENSHWEKSLWRIRSTQGNSSPASSGLLYFIESELVELSRPRVSLGSKPGLPPWGPHVRFRRQTLVREGSPLVKLRNSERGVIPARCVHRFRSGSPRLRQRLRELVRTLDHPRDHIRDLNRLSQDSRVGLDPDELSPELNYVANKNAWF